MQDSLFHLSPCTAAQPRVLLVEDNPIQARVLTALIRRMGLCPVGPATTALEALALCRQEFPALAILDIELPGELDGIDVATQLQQIGQIPVIFLSASQDEHVLRRIAQVQPLAFLPKPYQPSVLQQIITEGLMQSAVLVPPVLSGPDAPAAPANLFIRESNTLVRLNANDIVSVHALQQHAVLTLLSGRRHSVRLTLAEILTRLPASHFVQCHRSWLINTRCIEKIELSAGLVRLLDGTEAAVGRAYRPNIQQHLHILG